MNDNTIGELDIAVVAMAGRFPDAANINEFWDNLLAGKVSTYHATPQELEEAGIEPADNFINASLLLENKDKFDADFFGFSPKDAALMDPQIRQMLEVSWEALESAGYSQSHYEENIGHFAGMSMNSYLMRLVAQDPHQINNNILQARILNDKDFLSTWASYKLNLTGPVFTVQTACSSSLVAIHLACQSLLNGECEMALAGGVCIDGFDRLGYLHEEGSILSSDGKCRAFDAKASGTLSGQGIGMVLLKPLASAIEDRDQIYAVIKGSAINNDGANKLSYTAPNIDAQCKVICEALAVAEVDAETIGYVEAHGTGTKLGDPAEIRALTDAFRSYTEQKDFCAIGSVKSNIGHLDAAAGVAGFIKTALALKHGKIPPTLHVDTPNPQINFPETPFHVANKALAWPETQSPNRAGISSFAVGGTNAHIILEQPPEIPTDEYSRPWHNVMLSAKTASALERMKENLAVHIAKNKAQQLADMAYTLQIGRQDFEYRFSATCDSQKQLAEQLNSHHAGDCFFMQATEEKKDIVFLFPGQGSQYVGMGRELYQEEPVFKQHIDDCCTRLTAHLDIDLRQLIYAAPDAPDREQKSAQLNSQLSPQLRDTQYAQIALFITEYALAKLWMSWDVMPTKMIGHSIGEYVAACLSGVISLDDALKVVVLRGQLMNEMPAGSMLSVSLSAKELSAYLNDRLWHAVQNDEDMQVVSGAVEDIEALKQALDEKGIQNSRLHTSHGFHSGLMVDAATGLGKIMADIPLNAPNIPFASNLTGQWAEPDLVCQADYWAKQLRSTVRFSDNIQLLKQDVTPAICLEVGPGNVLCSLVKKQLAKTSMVVASLPNAKAAHTEQLTLTQAMGKMWCAGAKVDWTKYYADEMRNRICLPTYPFEKKRYWFNDKTSELTSTENSDVTDGSSLNADPLNETPLNLTAERPMGLSPFVAPDTEVQQKLAVHWGQVLGYQPVGIYDSFYDAGGHSLMAVSLLAKINKEFGLELSIKELLETYTIAELSSVIEAQQWLSTTSGKTGAVENTDNSELERLEL